MNDNGLRIATWNIASNKNFDAVMSRISGLGIDICALQEVSLDPNADLPIICDPAGRVFRDYHLHYSPALSPPEFGGGRPDYYGLGMVSKVPLSRAMSFPLGPRSAGSIRDAENEPRILQVAMPWMAMPLVVANTHLAATPDLSTSATRRSQVARIADILRPIVGAAPVILGGDFNVSPSSGDLTELRKVLPYVYAGKDATYIGEPDQAVVDFFCSSIPLDVSLTVVSADGLSDHNLVVATLAGLRA